MATLDRPPSLTAAAGGVAAVAGAVSAATLAWNQRGGVLTLLVLGAAAATWLAAHTWFARSPVATSAGAHDHAVPVPGARRYPAPRRRLAVGGALAVWLATGGALAAGPSRAWLLGDEPEETERVRLTSVTAFHRSDEVVMQFDVHNAGSRRIHLDRIGLIAIRSPIGGCLPATDGATAYRLAARVDESTTQVVARMADGPLADAEVQVDFESANRWKIDCTSAIRVEIPWRTPIDAGADATLNLAIPAEIAAATGVPPAHVDLKTTDTDLVFVVAAVETDGHTVDAECEDLSSSAARRLAESEAMRKSCPEFDDVQPLVPLEAQYFTD